MGNELSKPPAAARLPTPIVETFINSLLVFMNGLFE
jgi:hypothetical protein